MSNIGETLHGLPLFRRGKVRDTWEAGDDLLMVASDRVSAFDVILPTRIPDKGIVLTQLSRFWFDRLGDIVPNHLITTVLPDASDRLPPDLVADPDLANRSMLVRRAERIDVECVVRGFLYGSVWSEYQREGSVAGVPLPAGLRFADRLPEPIFSPALKVDDGHDVNVSAVAVADRFGVEVAQELERISLALYGRATAHAEQRGLILADTKFEFGYIDGRISLIDEVLTPDSSRYWDARLYEPGADQPSFDKQFVRDWLASSGWDREPPAPELPTDIVLGTQQRYRDAFRAITGAEMAEYRS
ncbi:MAG TPA: phosphoribosylaminoimidazolesuccinocarboxamide synthase [Thermomicrobiales bacterium]|jgi:phosphoribosylaminoimidazole-succinocarboxamide synthase|nr:phosphoribosylaminoimidazolesuccinocarboxamide synthase [Thermomicrobiales bacterium]